MNPAAAVVQKLVAQIVPFDDVEAEHRQDALAWIASGAPLFRIAKPANPPKHLVSYIILPDQQQQKILLTEHVKAQLWLPAGGHVEINEDPTVTAARELQEELATSAKFNTQFGSKPLFVTITATKGADSHLDVSLWYVMSGDTAEKLQFDAREMNSYRWFSFDEVFGMDISELDPQLHRFGRKLQSLIQE